MNNRKMETGFKVGVIIIVLVTLIGIWRTYRADRGSVDQVRSVRVEPHRTVAKESMPQFQTSGLITLTHKWENGVVVPPGMTVKYSVLHDTADCYIRLNRREIIRIPCEGGHQVHVSSGYVEWALAPGETERNCEVSWSIVPAPKCDT